MTQPNTKRRTGPKCPKCGQTMHRRGKTPGGATRFQCGGHHGEPHCYSTTDAQAKAVTGHGGSTVRSSKTPIFKRSVGDTVRFLVSAAQNATPRHAGFIKSLETAANKMNAAEIYVIPLRYKNPTSRFAESQRNEEWWDIPTAYLCNQRKRINKNLMLMGDIKIQATASEPLRGFEAITHGESGIFGHTKLQLKTVPVPNGKFPKIITTTGACTIPNYTDTALGKKGEFHHFLGAAVVEVNGNKFHLRQLGGDKETGSFIDLDRWYTPDHSEAAPPAAGLVMGDTHRDFIAPSVEHATFGKGGLIELLRPKHLVWHDLNDNYAVNPHHRGNPFSEIAKRASGRHDARGETERACQFVVEKTPAGCLSVVVFSNHNHFLTRWIINTDWRTLADQRNVDFYLKTAQYMAEHCKIGRLGLEYPDAFVYWAKQLIPESVGRVLSRDESFMVANVECGMHGDDGPNGSRGSPRNLARIGVKSDTGHIHGPGINEGNHSVGTSTERSAEYTHGPGSWMQTHGVIYASGKRSLIHLIDGEFRA